MTISTSSPKPTFLLTPMGVFSRVLDIHWTPFREAFDEGMLTGLSRQTLQMLQAAKVKIVPDHAAIFSMKETGDPQGVILFYQWHCVPENYYIPASNEDPSEEASMKAVKTRAILLADTYDVLRTEDRTVGPDTLQLVFRGDGLKDYHHV